MGPVCVRGFGFFPLCLIGCEPVTLVSPRAWPKHQVFLADSPPEGSQEPILSTSPSISQALSPCLCLLFFLIKVARARIPSQKVQPCVWMSSSRLCHCRACLHWQLGAGAQGTQGRGERGSPEPVAQPACLPTPPCPPPPVTSSFHKPLLLPNLTGPTALPSAMWNPSPGCGSGLSEFSQCRHTQPFTSPLEKLEAHPCTGEFGQTVHSFTEMCKGPVLCAWCWAGQSSIPAPLGTFQSRLGGGRTGWVAQEGPLPSSGSCVLTCKLKPSHCALRGPEESLEEKGWVQALSPLWPLPVELHRSCCPETRPRVGR